MTQPKITLDPSQAHAVELVCGARLGIVTGGPGTGKSTCLSFALDQLDDHGVRYELCAPTGKAAKRINETTGRPARTIHRLLGWRGGEWMHNASNPLSTQVVIVDESSMVDVELAAALLSAIDPQRTRLVLVGDADQLPPVGPGRVFGDLVDASEAGTVKVPLVRLKVVHRAALESWVCRNAPRMLAGEMPELDDRDDFRFIDVGDAAKLPNGDEISTASKLLPEVRRMMTEWLPKHVEVLDAQLLIPQRKGPAGIEAANQLLQQTYNPKRPGAAFLPRDGYEVRVGDRVIQTANNYDLEVFNGEVAQITDIADGKVHVAVEGRTPDVVYTLEQATKLELAYGLTVHRAQGSEFPWVVCVVHSTHSHMLTRQLLYTAVTRAKKGVVIVGDKKGLRHALSERKPATRNTGLIERMRGEL